MIKLTMLLAQGPGLPEGDLTDRLEISLALTPQGQIDMAAYDVDPSPWIATREQPSRQTRQFELTRLDEHWALQSVRSEDDPLWTFEGTVFRPGELVILRRPDSEQFLFRIVAADAQ